jgi:hypothetical protein
MWCCLSAEQSVDCAYSSGPVGSGGSGAGWSLIQI